MQGTITTHESGVDWVVEWQIQGFSTLPKTDGAGYWSPIFSFGGERWFLKIFPNGNSHWNSSGDVDMWLHKCDSGRSIRLSFSLSLKTAKGERHKEKHVTKVFDNSLFNWVHGLSRFVPGAELTTLRSDLLPDDVLTVVCTMKGSTSAGSENHNCREKLLMALCIASIIIAVITGCVLAYCKTPLSSSHPGRESLPQPVLMVTEIGSTYLDVVWILSEKSTSNSAHLHYILLYRKYGGQWQVVSFSDGSGTSYSLTNLDPGTSYQIYIMAVDSSGFSKHSEIATVRTSNKVIDHNSPKYHEKRLVLYAAAIIILVISIACVYHYSKTSLSAMHAYGEETQTISAKDENVIIADRPEVAETDESEESESKTSVPEIERPVSLKSLPDDYGFVTDINHLLKDNRGIDVTFELETASGETKIFAHQLILAVMSPHFADEFYDKGRNKGHRVIPLRGIDPKAFEQMIRYCYGETPTLKTTEEACVLFKIATEYKVRSLQNLCCSFFRHTNINPGDVFCILEISEEMEDNSLKNMCHKILHNKTREVMASYELCDITPAMVHIILDMPSISLESEYDLIKWIFEWGRAKSEDKDSCCRSTRDYLEDLLQNMNFLALTVEEFAILSRDYPKVFNSDERASISLNIACPGSWKMPVWYNKNLKCRVYTGSNE